MKKIFGRRKEKPPPLTVDEAADRINRRGDVAEEKIKKLEAELLIFKEQIKKTRPGPAQDVLKARALRILKQKKMYEAQRNMLYNQSFKLERVSFATEGIKDAQQTMMAMRAGNKDLEGTLKILNIDDVDKLQDEITNIVDASNEIQDSLVQGHDTSDHQDEEDLLGELDEMEAVARTETQASLGSGLAADHHEVSPGDLSLPSAPTGKTNGLQHTSLQTTDESGLPAVPRSSIRT